MAAYRAYYLGGEEYAIDESSWKDLPATGVLVVVQYRDTGKTVFAGGDWYWLDSKCDVRYLPTIEWGIDRHPPDIQCRSCLKKGVAASDEEFQMTYRKAFASQPPE